MNKKIFLVSGIVILCALLGFGGYSFYKQRDIVSARQTLISFFTLLNEKQYTSASEIYGGDADELQTFGIIGSDGKTLKTTADLLENGCNNVLKCLKIRKVLDENIISATGFEFTVEFSNDDGGIYELDSVKTNFKYDVEKISGKFLVKTMPIYDERF